jgi:hypothetical protein
MGANDGTIRRLGLKRRLNAQLVKLRQRGLVDPKLDDLTDVLTVAELLIDHGTQRERVEAALELAIGEYERAEDIADVAKAQTVARLWFGLDPATRNTDHNDRHQRAADHDGVTLGTFRSHHAPDIIERLAGYLVDLYVSYQEEASTGPDGEAKPDGHERHEGQEAATDSSIGPSAPGPVDPADRTSQGRVAGRKPAIGRLSLAIAGTTFLAICLAVAILLIGNGSSSEESTPPPGSVVNAMTGKVDDHPVERGVPQGGPQIAGGPNFQACNLSAGAPCSDLRPRHPVVTAHAGDIINFKLGVFNPMARQLPYATFETSWGSARHPSQLEVTMNVEWLYAHHAGFGVPELDPVTIASPTTVNAPDLTYIPGSTTLLSRTGEVVGRLPDGIMGLGIALSHIGSPRSCFPCAFAYERYISFKARLK